MCKAPDAELRNTLEMDSLKKRKMLLQYDAD
jgi:hypothetical protein